MKHWSDLDNIIILDSNAAGDLLKFIKSQKKLPKVLLPFKRQKNSIVTVKNLRENNWKIMGETNKKSETISNILKILGQSYLKVRIDNDSEAFIKKAKYYWNEFKNDRDFDDPWLCSKIDLSDNAKKIILISNEKRFGQFLKRSKLRNKFNKKCLLIYNINNIKEIKTLI